MYDLENLNHVNRTRDRKRTTFASFLKYIEPLKDYGKSYYHYFYPDKKIYLGLIDHYFPGFLLQYRELEKIEERKKYIHSLYNGNLIMKYFMIGSGKALGSFMYNFQEYFGTKEQLEEYILSVNNTDIIMSKFGEINNINKI